MSKETPGRNQKHFGIIACSSCLAVLGLATLYDPEAAILLLFVLVFLFLFVFPYFSRLAQEKRERRATRQKQRHVLAAKKAIRDVKGQLQKPDFETRLKVFIKKNPRGNNSDEEVNSRMKFWEREENYERTSTRPVELLRQLLQRIAKLVGRG